MRLSIIAAMAENRVIGKDNTLPWHLPADLAYFKKVTLGKPIVMGRKTFESIGRPLPGRTNIVITRDQHFQASGCIVVHSIEEAMATVVNEEDVFVIGGAELYQKMLPFVQRVYLTVIHADFAGGVFFPEMDLNEWVEVERLDHESDALNRYAYSFVVFEKKQ